MKVFDLLVCVGFGVCAVLLSIGVGKFCIWFANVLLDFIKEHTILGWGSLIFLVGTGIGIYWWMFYDNSKT